MFLYDFLKLFNVSISAYFMTASPLFDSFSFSIIPTMKKNIKDRYNVVIIGGGHAGIEAALISARMGCSTLLVTTEKESVGKMPCNPSIGGLAKSHLVHELDALGGEMGINADCTGVQFKTLNMSRGPAVWATRVQCDKREYSRRMLNVVLTTPNLDFLEDEVVALAVEGGKIQGIYTAGYGQELIASSAVVVTSGTALRGRIYIGHHMRESGGDGRSSSNLLSASIADLGFKLIRLKTGTPPRLFRESIDYSKTTKQEGDTPPPFFSLQHQMFHVEHSGQPRWVRNRNCSTWNNLECGEAQLECWMSHTTEETHEIIRSNLSESALYGGDISGVGVRYCPSIEDKIVKFTHSKQHHVMLEPEGRRPEDYMYPNGLSNSLPETIQEKLVHSVPGLEKAEFAAFAYAIEYDSIDARELSHTLESKRIQGLFFAGQVNGTTGYEEAAGQGLIAGANAALKVEGREPLLLSREDAYIGVMVDDLVTKGTEEPYRMFTSRAERRLILRQDNVRYRLRTFAEQLGVLNHSILEESDQYEKLITEELERLNRCHSGQTSLAVLLARPGMRYVDLPFQNENLPPPVVEQVEIRLKYQGYILQEKKSSERSRRENAVKIPHWMDYSKISALRFESREKLIRVQPENLGQASRIPGVNPADIAVLSLLIKRGHI